MADLFIVFGASQAASRDTFLGWLDAIDDYPKAPDHVGALCVGLPAAITHVQRCTWYRQHPTDGRSAVRRDSLVSAIRNHPRIAAKLTPTQITRLRALIDGAVAIDASWTSVESNVR